MGGVYGNKGVGTICLLHSTNNPLREKSELQKREITLILHTIANN